MRLRRPRLTPIKEGAHRLMHRWSVRAHFFFGDHATSPATWALLHHGIDARFGELRIAPRVHGISVGTAECNVFGRAEEADVKMVIMRVARLACDLFEATDHGAWCTLPCGLLKQHRA